MIKKFDEKIWEQTIYLIKKKKCTPFIGAGASADALPLASVLAAGMAAKYNYPFDDRGNLARVTQYAAVSEQNVPILKDQLVDAMFGGVQTPDFYARDQPHAMLAELELPIYITTNYDDFMFQALEERGREPQRVICPWYIKDPVEAQQANSFFSERGGYDPKSSRPIVYHLHGHYSTPESLVVTEDDYIDFLVRFSGDPLLVPPKIKEALRSHMLLFVGYSLADWTFRVIFSGLRYTRSSYAQQSHVSVQLPPLPNDALDQRPARIQDYLENYFGDQNISICWKAARDFSAELRLRWEGRVQ